MKYLNWHELTEKQKIVAFGKEIELATHNATSKDDLLNMLRWLWGKFEIEESDSEFGPVNLNDVGSDKLPDMGEVSDGYHTFNELYHHRAVLFSMICNSYPAIAYKSKQHSDSTMYDNMFIVGIETPFGHATYHYDVKPYWDYFNVKEFEKAPEWDGHTPDEAIDRILAWSRML
jgi:hypothetical protein